MDPPTTANYSGNFSGDGQYIGNTFSTNSGNIYIQNQGSGNGPLDWLSSLNFADTLKRHCDKRTQFTGQWLLDHSSFQRWKSTGLSGEQVLWCRGDPGVGKTILCSMVIEHLRLTVTASAPVLYCYFEYARATELMVDAVFSDLLRQLYSSNFAQFQKALDSLHRACEHGRRQPTFVDLKEAFRSACQPLERVFIIIDGLDECEPLARHILMNGLDLSVNQSIKLFISSRPYLEMRAYIKDPGVQVVEIDVQIPRSDLTLFVNHRIAENEDLAVIMQEQGIESSEIADQVRSKTAPSFLAAEVYLNTIVHSGSITRAQLDAVLASEFTAFDKLYDSTFERIRKQDPAKARLGLMALGWLSVIKTPLSITELAHALAVSACKDNFSLDQVYAGATIMSACVGLAISLNNGREVRLVHSTVEEYLKEKNEANITEKTVLEACLRYIMLPDVDAALKQLSLPPDQRAGIIQKYSFVQYSISHWHEYIHLEAQESPLLSDFLSLHAQGSGKKDNYVNVLCIDGGGVRGLSTLIILDKLMQLVNEEISSKVQDSKVLLPSDTFDLVVGTSTGGLIALMLVKMRLSVNECIQMYLELSKEVFGSASWTDRMRGNYSRWERSTKKLSEVIQRFVTPQNQHTNTVQSEEATHNRESSNARTGPTSPAYFSDVDNLLELSGNGPEVLYGGNPSLAALDHLLEKGGPGAERVRMINIGTGSEPPGPKRTSTWINYMPSSTLRQIMLLMHDLGTMTKNSPDAIGSNLRSRAMVEERLDFNRFSADTGDIHAIRLDEYKRIPEIMQATNEYLARPNVSSELQKVAHELTETWRTRQSLRIASTARKLLAQLQSIQEISPQS